MAWWIQSKRELEHQVAEINASRPQCPVGLNTLVLPSKNTLSDSDKTPYVYLNCGHVHGQHSWGKGIDVNNCTCPMCLKVLYTVSTSCDFSLNTCLENLKMSLMLGKVTKNCLLFIIIQFVVYLNCAFIIMKSLCHVYSNH